MKVLVTGGAGFIGSNLVERLLLRGDSVILFDNLSRCGVEKNISWLKKTCKTNKLKIVKADIRNFSKVLEMVKGVDVIFHLAAQVAVTSSVANPREDFEINLLGTLNVLEAARCQKKKPIVIYSSTNKVYGKLSLKDEKIGNGIKETQPLDFYSPYGVSKGASDQYVHDYARIYGLPTVVFRQSCVYGQHQMGMEDQGWLAHFVISVLKGKTINIFGDGKQIRDLLYVDDLIDAYLLAVEKIEKVRGEIFNIGGGRANAISIIDAIKLIEKKTGRKVKLKFAKERPGDQKIFISNNKKLKDLLGFSVKTNYSQGLDKLISWLQNQNP